METLTQQDNQVSIIEKSLDVLKTGPDILIANKIRNDKALAVGRNILRLILEEGMSPEADERAMKYLVNVTAAKTEMKNNRAGVTQIMDQLKSMFTEVENDLDVKKPGTIPAQIQEHRNKYARDLAAEKERKRKETERTAAKSKEAIEIKYTVENKYNNEFNAYLLERKQDMQNRFNAITLENYEQKSLGLKSKVIKCEFVFSRSSVNSIYHATEETRQITDKVIAECEKELTDNFIAEMNLLKDELIDKLHSKLVELQEHKKLADEALAEKDKKKKAELKAQQEKVEADRKKREEEEKQNLQQASQEALQKQIKDADIKKQGEQTMVLFDQEAAMAESTPAPETRQGFEITILHPVGYIQIFALWFENEGKNLPVDKIGNTKLEQMKAWAEKHAHKTGTRIESKFIKYEESFKAVNRKAVK